MSNILGKSLPGPCPVCPGTGKVQVQTFIPYIGGPTLLLIDWPREVSEHLDYWVRCPECRGSGLASSEGGRRQERRRFKIVLD